MKSASREQILAAIDVGTNAVKLEIARPLPDGRLETLHQERDPVRPGEGVFKTGTIPEAVVVRLLATLRRYGALCRRHGARVRAVATSAVREAKNRDAIIARVRREAGLELDVASGREEARLIALGVLQGRPASARSICLDIGGGSTEVMTAIGERPVGLWSVALGAVRLAQLFGSGGRPAARDVTLMREYAREAVAESLPNLRSLSRGQRRGLGSSGNVRAVVAFAAAEGTAHVTRRQITRAVEELVAMGPQGRQRRFEPNRADIILPGAVILEALVTHLGLESVAAVDRGLRDGILIDLMRRRNATASERWLVEAALNLGRRCHFDEPHGQQVADLALALFDQLPRVHGLGSSVRPLLEVAALLHDIGNLVAYPRHHRHTYYLIQHADIPGLGNREREIVARVARAHRRSLPSSVLVGSSGLNRLEVTLARKLAMLLRVADALDRSHHQPIDSIRATGRPSSVTVRVRAHAPVDLELWDLGRETTAFREVFGRRLVVSAEVKPRPSRARR